MIAIDESRKRTARSAFGPLLKRLRSAADLTQEELALRAGVSARLISDLERGAIHRPRRDTVQMLADGLSLTGDDRNSFASLARGRPSVDSTTPPIDATRHMRALPVPPTAIVGRLKEMAAIALLLRSGIRLLTLTGAGGVGKTRLALEVAARSADDFHGTAFVDLAPLNDPALVLPTIGTGLGVNHSAEQSPRDCLIDALSGRRLLLVLDNFEGVAAAATDIADLLGNCESLTILATSRSLLHIRAEHEYRVEPLALPDLNRLPSTGELGQIPAVDLFVSRAEAACRDFALTDRNAPAVAEITVRLDGLPLAIELAAARVKVLPPSVLLARLERRLPLLTGGARDLPLRLQAMRSTIDWSYDLLDPNEQWLFHRLAVFSGDCTLDAAEWVVGNGLRVTDGAVFPLPITLDLLTALVDKSLLRLRESNDEAPRFGMLETIREYSLERLTAAGDEAEARRRHATWCLELAERAEPELSRPDQTHWLATLDTEHDNLRAALGWTIARGDAETALRLCGALYHYWDLRDHYTEGRRWLEHALALDADVDPAVRAKALLGAGAIANRQGDYERATALEEALSIYRTLEDMAGVASALASLGKMAGSQGKYARGTTLKEEALAIFRTLGDQARVGTMLISLGLGAYDQGQFDRAAVLLEEALATARAMGNRNGAALSLNNLALVALVQGDVGRAAELQEEVIEIWRLLGNKDGLAHCFENVALIAAAKNESVRAARLFGAAEALRAQIGAPGRLIDRDSNERCILNTRSQLGEDAFAHAWEAGRAMSLDQAIAYAVHTWQRRAP